MVKPNCDNNLGWADGERDWPVRMDIVVVLPAPLCPRRAVIWPLYMAKFMPATATFFDWPSLNSWKQRVNDKVSRNVNPKCEPQMWTPNVNHKCEPQMWIPNVTPNVNPKCEPQMWTPNVNHKCEPQMWTTNVNHKCEPKMWWTNVNPRGNHIFKQPYPEQIIKLVSCLRTRYKLSFVIRIKITKK